MWEGQFSCIFPPRFEVTSNSSISVHPDLVSVHILMKEISLHLIFCNLPFLLHIYLELFHATAVYILNHSNILTALRNGFFMVLFFFCNYKPGLVSVLASLCTWMGTWVVSGSFL